jgi:hypothetical protein
LEVSDQLHALAALTPVDKPLDKRLGEPQSGSGSCGVEKKSLALAGNETPAVHLVARRYIELSRSLRTTETLYKSV